MCDPIKFRNITYDQILLLAPKLDAQGTVVGGFLSPSKCIGQIKGRGITASFSWTGDSKVLTIVIEKKPWYLSCEYIEFKIEKGLNETHTGNNQTT